MFPLAKHSLLGTPFSPCFSTWHVLQMGSFSMHSAVSFFQDCWEIHFMDVPGDLTSANRMDRQVCFQSSATAVHATLSALLLGAPAHTTG